MSAADDKLEAQLAHLRSDDRLREQAAMFADLTPEQRLEIFCEMSKTTGAILSAMSDEDFERHCALHAAEAPGPDAEGPLRRLASLARVEDDDAR